MHTFYAQRRKAHASDADVYVCVLEMSRVKHNEHTLRPGNKQTQMEKYDFHQ